MEIWKDIPWYEWKYQISDLGRMKSFRLLNQNSKYRQWVIMKWSKDKDWYIQTTIWKIHRLVLVSFRWISILDCNHINNIRNDNRLINLEYCTKSENELHKYKTWYISHSNKKVWQFKKWKLLRAYISIIKASEYTWIHRDWISHNCRWKHKTAWWYEWKFM